MERQSQSSSSDDEDDAEALIAQNETKAPPPSLHRIASFEIGRLSGRIGRSLGSGKKYLLAVCLPLLLILVFFSVDVGRLFHGVSTVSFVPPVEDRRVREAEAELRALYLLRDQRLGLLRLWNRTAVVRSRSGSIAAVPPPAPISSSNSTPNSNQTVSYNQVRPLPPPQPTVSFEDFRSALLEQIKLNQQIQKTLLSTHRPVAGNATAEVVDNTDDLLSGSGDVDVCKKVEKPAEKRTIEWKPKKNMFLFAICVSGQMSNHLICLQKHMFFAALLNRVLVLPSPKFDYHYDKVIDVNHINKCLGRKVVISFEEFSEMKKNKMHINRFICYTASPPCFLDEEHTKRLKALGLSLSKIEAAWPEDAKLSQPKRRTVDDITSKFASDDEVLAIGDMFYANVEEEWVMQPGGPIAHKCETLIQPSHLIVLTAQRFVQTFLGNNFIALHFRRHGFLKFCIAAVYATMNNAKDESCFFPVPQAAECILRVVEKADAQVIYLSTDAASSETNLLQSLIVLNDKTIPLIKRPDHTSVEKWDALLFRNHLLGDSQVEAMLDKTICAMSNVFIGSSGSTFTDDIFRLRRDWGSSSVCDENLCPGEKPNFIADKE
ncbi:hypothetical protein Taro_013191 [Colocasia esculenta]|uniref:GDP-fucose protein O-fucosyltransferase 2 n=1 Tax=Colocasia esculenta TaxID=4460 RepID=A0A843UFJ8_COLES|nr:hypothetical protein [Colocasia esculenta]